MIETDKFCEKSMNVDQIISLLNLKKLPNEGGFYYENYRSKMKIPQAILGGAFQGERDCSTAIYYLITPNEFSAFHRLPQDEIFHFYLGDPVELVQIDSDQNLKRDILGQNIQENQKLQVVVPGNDWQALQLIKGGSWALLGTTVSPGFDFQDFILGDRKELLEQYPQYQFEILTLTR